MTLVIGARYINEVPGYGEDEGQGERGLWLRGMSHIVANPFLFKKTRSRIAGKQTGPNIES